MKYEIRNTYPALNQVSVFDADTNKCQLTGALTVAQAFIFFRTFLDGKQFRTEEYNQANAQAILAWNEQSEAFCKQAQIGSVIES